jgi:hypothetical protein
MCKFSLQFVENGVSWVGFELIYKITGNKNFAVLSAYYEGTVDTV